MPNCARASITRRPASLQAQILLVRSINQARKRRVVKHFPPVLVGRRCGIYFFIFGFKPGVRGWDIGFFEIRANGFAPTDQQQAGQRQRSGSNDFANAS